MTIEACAEIVRRGDPDRFQAALAAPPAARNVLFPLYAFNVEVARAPWVTNEALIAEMRLQWWRDALDEIAGGAAVRRHEVTTPLALALDRAGAEAMKTLVTARRADLEKVPFADAMALDAYLDATGAALMWTAARLLGAPCDAEPAVRQLGFASSAASYLLAVPALQALGRVPFAVDDGPSRLSRRGLDALGQGRRAIARVPGRARAALFPGWQAAAILTRAGREPSAVTEGRLRPAEAGRRWRLLRTALTGRI